MSPNHLKREQVNRYARARKHVQTVQTVRPAETPNRLNHPNHLTMRARDVRARITNKPVHGSDGSDRRSERFNRSVVTRRSP